MRLEGSSSAMIPQLFRVPLSWVSCFATLVAFQLLIKSTFTQTILHSFTGTVGAGNYTYYRLSRKGDLTILLQTLEGDADLYVSDKTDEPTFENYEVQSVTCGEDMVNIPASFQRPINIGVYGHISKMVSTYRLMILADSLDKNADGMSNRQSNPEEEESIVWTIFVSILKILIDVLL